MNKTKLVVLALLAILVGDGCNRQNNKAVEILTGNGVKATQAVTIHYDTGSNTCTQKPGSILPLQTGQMVNYSTDAPNPATITVSFPRPNVNSNLSTFPDSPFLVASPNQWQWTVQGGTDSKPAAVTSLETPNDKDIYFFFYSQIVINGNPCILGDPQGMGVSVQR